MIAPLVSILMVARNAAPFIDAAIVSARTQSLSDIEVVVVDDGSSDGTDKIVRTHAECDPRVRLVQGPRKGLSAVRNASLKAARGRFGAILDSDDILHPRHLEWLVAGWAKSGGQICATNMLEFREEGANLDIRRFASGLEWAEARQIAPAEFIERGLIGAKAPSLGYLKPLIDMEYLRSAGLRYDESLRIGEDFDLVLRTMLTGGRYGFQPQATYYYRRHAASTSHRLDSADLDGLLKAMVNYKCGAGGELPALLDQRRMNLKAALRHLEAIDAIKAGQPLRAASLVIGSPDARRMLFSTLKEAVAKRIDRIGWLSPREIDEPGVQAFPSATLADRLADALQSFQSSKEPGCVR